MILILWVQVRLKVCFTIISELSFRYPYSDLGCNLPHKLSSELVSLLSDSSNHLYFSSASIWEISIKESFGKKDFKFSSKKLYDGLIENGYKKLKVSALHAMEVIKLPFIHRDPFDRILVATAIWENMPLVNQ